MFQLYKCVLDRNIKYIFLTLSHGPKRLKNSVYQLLQPVLYFCIKHLPIASPFWLTLCHIPALTTLQPLHPSNSPSPRPGPAHSYSPACQPGCPQPASKALSRCGHSQGQRPNPVHVCIPCPSTVLAQHRHSEHLR